MTKSQIVRVVASRLDISESLVLDVLNEAIKTMYTSLAKMEEVQMDGLGKFVSLVMPPSKKCSNLPGKKTYIHASESIKIKYIVSPKMLSVLKPLILKETDIDYNEVIKKLNID